MRSDININQIIGKLEEWKRDILYDITQEKNWGTDERDCFIQREQFRKLDQAIMILKSIGSNNNITE